MGELATIASRFHLTSQSGIGDLMLATRFGAWSKRNMARSRSAVRVVSGNKQARRAQRRCTSGGRSVCYHCSPECIVDSLGMLLDIAFIDG